ncbi:hypothetical protein IKG07_01855 [Candidatus Saccharibacteria bacterium]|nr:hypothetical protein [Candidatus Saccharibacteria bacterium]
MFFNGKTNSSTERIISRSRRFRIVSTGAFSLLAILTLLAVFPIAKHKEDAEATTVPATTSLSITSSKDTASVDITPTSKDGTFAISAAADQAEFSVTTDNLTGYSVTLLGSDTSGQLVNNITGDTLDTITSNTTESDFRTGSASTYANKWGYRLNINNTTTTDFMAAPTTNTAKTIYSTNAPNTTGTSDNFTLALGARVDYEKQTGTYTNTFVLTAVGNPITYKITYWDDTDKLGEDGQANITASKFTISQADPTKAGAVFKGWCYGTADYSANPTACSGTPAEVYNNGDDFTFTSIPSTGTAEANLYAMWQSSPNIMQNLDPTTCTAIARTVTDIRDGQQYTIQRLKDGNCWLLDNLNLGSVPLVETLSASNTNMDPSTPFTLPTTSTTTGFNSTTTAMINTDYENTTTTYWGVGGGKTGVYYNYCAVTAGTYCTSSGSGNASYDICPAGWRIPTGGSDGEYQALYVAYSSSHTDFKTALSLPTSGNYLGNGPGSRNAYGNFWSSTIRDSNSMYYMFASESGAWPLGNEYGTRNYGYSVRCVLDDVPAMQNVSSTQLEKMIPNTGDTTYLKDSRDGKRYKVTRLTDGNVWMTQNLGFTGTTLTPSDSNVSSSVSITYGDLTSGDSTTEARIHDSGNTTNGVWYNYAAASAMQITTDSTDEAINSVCPKGWRLPSHSEFDGIVSSTSDFNPVAGGNYYDKNLIDTTSGYWWESDAFSASQRYNFYYNGSTLNNTYYYYRYIGNYVRCIKDDGDLPAMQDVTDEDLETLIPNVHDTITLKDSRDGKKYKVGRLKDGNVWMVSDLNLAGGTTLNASDSNVPTDNYYTLPASSATGFDDDTKAFVYNTGNETTDQANCNTSPGCNSYYSWLATVAGNQTNVTGYGNDAPYSICPKGWRLPKSGDSRDNSATSTTGYKKGDFYELATAYGVDLKSISTDASSVFYDNAGPGTTPNFLLAGYYRSSSSYNGGKNGHYWSSSSYLSTTEALSLYLLSSTVSTSSREYRQRGLSVRCIKDDDRTVNDITYMQQINSQIVAKMSDGDTKTLIDARDGQEYTTAKLNGRLWMTRNLAIGCDGSGSTYGSGYAAKTLTPADTNIITYYNTPIADVSTTSYDEGKLTCNSTYGAYYNYAATTAGTITGSSNKNSPVYDICPKGWRMPSYSEVAGIVSYTSQFNPVTGNLYSTGYGYWWTTTYYTTTARYLLRYNGSSISTDSNSTTERNKGLYTRCIAI